MRITLACAGDKTGSLLIAEAPWETADDLASLISELDEYLRSKGHPVETGFVGSVCRDGERRIANWSSLSVCAVDIDTPDHTALSVEQGEALSELIDNGELPGTLVYFTPAGCRVLFGLSREVLDIDEARRAIEGAFELVRRALPPTVIVSADRQTRDLVRFSYGPNAFAKGRQRSEDVYLIGDGALYDPEELTAHAPLDRTRDPRDLRLPIAQISAASAALVKRHKHDLDAENDGSMALMRTARDAILGLHIYREEDWLTVAADWNARRGDLAHDIEELRSAFQDAFARFEQERQGKELFAPLENAEELPAAERFVYYLEQEAPHVYDLDVFWRYESVYGSWREVPEHEIRNEIMERMGGHPAFGARGGQLGLSNNRIEGIRKIAESLLARPCFFEGTAHGIAVLNGFLRVDGATIRLDAHDPEHRAKHTLPFSYDPAAKDELWEDFLTGLFKGAEDSTQRVNLLQEFAGAALFGLGTRYQAALVLVGDGANGKSLWLDAIAGLLPAAARTSIRPQAWDDQHARYELRNALLNSAGELPRKAIIESSWTKAIIGGDEIPARQVYGAAVSFRPRATHIFACNELPRVYDTSEGWARRMRVVEFPNRFVVNPMYADAVRDARRSPAVLNWAIAGAARVLGSGGYVDAGTTERSVAAEWRLEGDPVAEFAGEILERVGAEEPDRWTPAMRLYQVFRSWYVRTRGPDAPGRDTFLKGLKRCGFTWRRDDKGKYYSAKLRLDIVREIDPALASFYT